jgi:hypothetical protein
MVGSLCKSVLSVLFLPRPMIPIKCVVVGDCFPMSPFQLCLTMSQQLSSLKVKQFNFTFWIQLVQKMFRPDGFVN